MRILAVDLGLARTGLALSDEGEFLASPVGTLYEKDLNALKEKICEIAREKGASLIVVGYPRNMDGSTGESAERCLQFAKDLAAQSGIETVLWDERCTTKSAIGFLNTTDTRGKKRKAVVDTVAAVIILQDYLDYRKRNKG